MMRDPGLVSISELGFLLLISVYIKFSYHHKAGRLLNGIKIVLWECLQITKNNAAMASCLISSLLFPPKKEVVLLFYFLITGRGVVLMYTIKR